MAIILTIICAVSVAIGYSCCILSANVDDIERAKEENLKEDNEE